MIGSNTRRIDPLSTMLVAIVVSIPHPVLAFSDPARFEDSADSGGGGGRHFTGSPVDGFSCGVCHRGAEPPRFTITGLPDFFDINTRYEVVIRWDEPDRSGALQLELWNSAGHPHVELPALTSLPADARCDGLLDGAPAAYTIDVGTRRVVGLEDCGASELAFSFIAPDEETIVFAVGAVATDSSGTSDGDGVSEIRRTLHRRDDSRKPTASCATGSRDSSAALGWVMIVLAQIRWRHRQPLRRARYGDDV